MNGIKTDKELLIDKIPDDIEVKNRFFSVNLRKKK